MHTDPELLSLLALGEPVGTDDERSHVLTCATCAAEVEELRRLVTLARGVDDDIELAVPSPQVWSRIREGLALPAAPESLGGADEPVATDDPLPRRLLRDALAEALGGASGGPAAVLAHATLTSLHGDRVDQSGQAVISTDELGRRILQLALEAVPASPGIRHAWLVDRDDPARRQSLGMLDGPFGVWTVDRSIDLRQYAVLDISEQDADGPAQTGRSIVRGEFTLVS